MCNSSARSPVSSARSTAQIVTEQSAEDMAELFPSEISFADIVDEDIAEKVQLECV